MPRAHWAPDGWQQQHVLQQQLALALAPTAMPASGGTHQQPAEVIGSQQQQQQPTEAICQQQQEQQLQQPTPTLDLPQAPTAMPASGGTFSTIPQCQQQLQPQQQQQQLQHQQQQPAEVIGSPQPAVVNRPQQQQQQQHKLQQQ